MDGQDSIQTQRVVNKSNPYFLILIIAILTFTFALSATLKHETADEGFHTPVVYMWYNGQFQKPENLTVLPVYHAIVAGLMHALDLISVKSMRFITLLLGAISIPVFYFLCKLVQADQRSPDKPHLDSTQQAEIRTLMFVLCPLILPFFSLVYTDLPSLTLVVAFIFFMMKSWHWPAAAIALFAVFFRQTAMVWVGYCGLYILTQSWLAHRIEFKQRVLAVVKDTWLKLLPYALVFCAFAVFVYFNKGLSAGDTDLQKVAFNPSNVYFYLLLCFFLFLPYNFEYSQRVYQLVSRSYIPWMLLAIFFLIFLYTYNNQHQYNSYGLKFYLRNILLHFTVTNFALKVLAFIAMSWMALTFYLMAIESKKSWQLFVLYFTTFVCLLPLPLVEQRYYIPALALFLIWKPGTHPVSDRLVLLSFIPVSATFIYGIAQHKFFL